MTEARRYAVTVALAAQDGTTGLLSLMSLLHRRGVDVGRPELSPESHGRRTFIATFTAHPGRAATIRASLANLVEVLDVLLHESAESPAPSWSAST